MKVSMQLIRGGESNLAGQVVRLVLWPFSWLYGLVCRVRLLLYRYGWLKQERLAARVVSVGNITVGGTGKTPLVIHLTQKLKERSRRVAILTRGYKREKREMVELTADNKEKANWREVGDEPYLLAGRLSDVPVMVGKRRAVSGKRAIERYGSEILLLDDGFQHLKVFRNLDIVVIDSVNPFGNGKLLPSGILREPVSSLRRADVFVLTKTDQTSDTDELIRILKTQNPRALVVRSVHRVSGMADLFDGSPINQRDVEGKDAFLFSGIGNPRSFEKTVEQLNVNILGHRVFPDHFAYRRQDAENLIRQAQAVGAGIIVTTEKDSVRIPLIKRPGIPFYALRIDLSITSGEELLADMVEGKK